jgi:hypothetical protein
LLIHLIHRIITIKCHRIDDAVRRAAAVH